MVLRWWSDWYRRWTHQPGYLSAWPDWMPAIAETDTARRSLFSTDTEPVCRHVVPKDPRHRYWVILTLFWDAMALKFSNTWMSFELFIVFYLTKWKWWTGCLSRLLKGFNVSIQYELLPFMSCQTFRILRVNPAGSASVFTLIWGTHLDEELEIEHGKISESVLISFFTLIGLLLPSKNFMILLCYRGAGQQTGGQLSFTNRADFSSSICR